MQATLRPVEPELARDRERALRRRARIGRAHIGDDDGAGGAAGRQQRAHAAVEMRVVAARRVGHAVAVAKATVRSPRHSSTMTSSLPRCARSTAGSSRSAEKPAPVPMRTPLRGPFIALARRSVASERGILREEQVADRWPGVRLIEPIFAMNCAVLSTFSGFSV